MFRGLALPLLLCCLCYACAPNLAKVDPANDTQGESPTKNTETAFAPVVISMEAQTSADNSEMQADVAFTAQNPVHLKTTKPEGIYQLHEIHLWTPPGQEEGEGSLDIWIRRKSSLTGVNAAQAFTLVDSVNGLESEPFVLDIDLPAPQLKDDSLYAVPCNIATPGQPVLIQVVSGKMRRPFQYLTGVRVTAPPDSGFTYVRGSLNVGAPGGAKDEPDGIWAAMNPDGFLMMPESMIRQTTTSYGYLAYDFNLSPLGGKDLQDASGPLFNFQATFSSEGAHKIRFQDLQVVERTYYQDGSLTGANRWYDTTNDQFEFDGEAYIWETEDFSAKEGSDPNTYWFKSGLN